MSACREYRLFNRRSFLRVGAVGAITLPHLLRAEDAARAPGRRSTSDMNAIFLWLGGGPAHLDTFDPKPNATAEVRGEFGVIPTSVPGCFLSEIMPCIARQMHRVSLVRSITHNIG